MDWVEPNSVVIEPQESHSYCALEQYSILVVFAPLDLHRCQSRREIRYVGEQVDQELHEHVVSQNEGTLLLAWLQNYAKSEFHR